MVKKICLIIALLIFLPVISAEISVNITVEPSFTIGDEIYFEYIITSDTAQEIIYAESVFCPEAPLPFLYQITENAGPGQEIHRNYTYMQVTEEMQPQTCTAGISIISPAEEIFEKNFTIDTLPELSFNILLCKDSYCNTESKIFLQNEAIYFSFISDPADPLTAADLTYPDETIKPINVPGSIIAEQTGTYTIEVTASKEEHKTVATKEQFAVIEKTAEIKTVNSSMLEADKQAAEVTCNNDNICSGEETADNCPSDCKASQGNPIAMYILIGLIALIIILIIVFILKIKKEY